MGITFKVLDRETDAGAIHKVKCDAILSMIQNCCVMISATGGNPIDVLKWQISELETAMAQHQKDEQIKFSKENNKDNFVTTQ